MVGRVPWHEYPESPRSTVVGTLVRSDPVHSDELDRSMRLLAHLPRSYGASNRRFPVLYMHDGDNLFDEVASYSGEWRVDETMELLAHEGIEAIVVGIPNAGTARIDEYTLFMREGRHGGRAALYLRFLVGTVKPLVDRSFRTEPARGSTGVMGSSLGGLVSLYAFFEHPDVFGLAGAMSPAFYWDDGRTLEYLEAQPLLDGRIYLDVGTNEIPGDAALSERYVDDCLRAREMFAAVGYGARMRCVVDDGATHHETEWARRLPDALRFLLD